MSKDAVDSIVDDLFRVATDNKFELEDILKDSSDESVCDIKVKKKKKKSKKSKKSKKEKKKKRSREKSPQGLKKDIEPSDLIGVKPAPEFEDELRKSITERKNGNEKSLEKLSEPMSISPCPLAEIIESEEEDVTTDYATAVVKNRKIPLNATKMSQFLKEKGHEASKNLIGLEQIVDKQIEQQKEDLPQIEESTVDKDVVPEIEPFPLAKHQKMPPSTSKLVVPQKSTKLLKDFESKKGGIKFLPRNLKVKDVNSKNEVDGETKKLEEPKSSNTREFNPPQLKSKQLNDLSVQNNETKDEDDFLAVGNTLSQNKQVKISFGRDLTKSIAIEFAKIGPIGEVKKNKEEDGEIRESGSSESESEKGTEEKSDEDTTEGELQDSDKESKVQEQLAKPKKSKGQSSKDYFSLSKKKKKKKNKDRSRSREKKNSRSHRRDSRSHSRSRKSRSRSRSPYKSIRRSDVRYIKMTGRGRRRPEPNKSDFPWGKGGYANRRRDRDGFRPNRTYYPRSRSRSKSKSRSRSGSRSRCSKKKKRNRSNSSSNSRSRSPENRKKQRKCRSRSNSSHAIDKKKLFEIARKNASVMMKAGTLQAITNMTSEELASLKSGGKSVDELVDYCKKIQKKEAGLSMSEEEDDEQLSAFVRHPFEIKNNAIVLNIPNAVPIPIKTPLERKVEEGQLRLTFPVSSGSVHRDKEDEWVPVKKGTLAIEAPPKSIPMLMPPPPMPPPSAMRAPPPPSSLLSLPAPPPPPPRPQEPLFDTEIVTAPSEDISAIVSQRLSCVKKLQDNPNDLEALTLLHSAEEKLKNWAKSKNLPGAFTGSTGVQCLKVDQLGPPDKRFQAWVKKDQLKNAGALNSGKGLQLLQKMGWNPGEGLGKNKVGTLEPLMLDLKTDRKGLVALEEMPVAKHRPHHNFASSLHGKHPVSALLEVCAKKNWGPPGFNCFESGNAHNRRFLWKVIVNGVEYAPACPHGNKKLSKAHTAQVALQSLGILPSDPSSI